MIPSTSFAFHVTYTCPLECSHCCFSSGPKNKDKLSLDIVLETIENLDRKNIGLVAFTGGEPLLFGENLNRAISKAHQLGFTTRVVTSAYFANSIENGRSIISKLRNSGLDELSISWDDYHEKYVDFACVKNAFKAARELGISVAINIVQDEDSYWNADLVAREIGSEEVEIVCESPINKTGRAKVELKDKPLKENRFLGPCPYILTGPTLSAKGKLLACCGVIPETDDLVISDDYKPSDMSVLMDSARKSVIYNWIYLRGPYSILEYMSLNFDLKIPKAEDFGGNCEACAYLFENFGNTDELGQAAQQMASNISGEINLLSQIGILEPAYITSLWGPGKANIDTSHLPSKEDEVHLV